MTSINYAKQSFELGKNESVLDCLTGHGIPIPFACQSGVCQTCLMRAIAGVPPESAQQGLKNSLKIQNYFLACVCYPEDDLEVVLPDEHQATVDTTVRKLELLSEEIMLVELECHAPFEYRAGQFVNLVHDSVHIRSYSIASVPGLDKYLQLHVRRLPEGRVSGWIHDDLTIGHPVEIRGPAGDCLYVPGNPEQAIMLIGTGAGLAPLYGILRDALNQGHSGPVRLFHGSRDRRGLYLVEELRELSERYANFDYIPCLSGTHVPPGFTAGRAHEEALKEVPNLKDWRVYLCGHPEMVKIAKKKAYLGGAAMKDIYADAFNVNQA